MLRLHLSPRQDLDRGLEAAARGLFKVIEDGVSEGLRIIAYPSIDSLIAASVLFTVASGLGAHPVLTVAPKPGRVYEPTVILGGPEGGFKLDQAGQSLFAMWSGEGRGAPPPGSIVVDLEGSVSAGLGLILREAKTVGARLEPLLFLLAGVYNSRFTDSIGRMHGLDKVYAESLLDSAGGALLSATTVNVYKPHVYGLCEAIDATVFPLYHGLAGRQCTALAEAVGIDPSSRPAELDEDGVEKLARSLAEALQTRYQHVRPVDVVSWSILAAPGQSRILDPRVAGHAFILAVESTGVENGLALALDADNEYPMAEAFLERYRGIIEEVLGETPIKVKLHSWLRGYRVSLPEPASPTLAWRILSWLRIIDSESLILYEVDGRLAASALQAEEALGAGGVKKLIDTKVAEAEGAVLWIRQSA